MAGKGDKQRKRQISFDDYADSWDRIFKKSKEKQDDREDSANEKRQTNETLLDLDSRNVR